jgi:hypothetical protein
LRRARDGPERRATRAERAGVREVWFVHPTDRLVPVYEHLGERFARPAISELSYPGA